VYVPCERLIGCVTAYSYVLLDDASLFSTITLNPGFVPRVVQ